MPCRDSNRILARKLSNSCCRPFSDAVASTPLLQQVLQFLDLEAGGKRRKHRLVPLPLVRLVAAHALLAILASGFAFSVGFSLIPSEPHSDPFTTHLHPMHTLDSPCAAGWLLAREDEARDQRHAEPCAQRGDGQIRHVNGCEAREACRLERRRPERLCRAL